MISRGAGPDETASPSRVEVETMMPRGVAAIAAFATFIDPGVGCSGRDPSRQRKAHYEDSNPFHVWTYVRLMQHLETA